MNFDLNDIAMRLSQDAPAAISGWEAYYHTQIAHTAEAVAENRRLSPVVLLSGPSGSSKTTTGTLLRNRLIAMEIPAHLISMDNYFLGIHAPGFPRLSNGELDFESPLCMDIPLLNQHFAALEHGEDIDVPIYDFPTSSRLEGKCIHMDASQGDVFIFEGIHALNELFTSQHPNAYRLFVSPVAVFSQNGKVVCSSTQLRLMRRMVRDYNFRGASAEYSLSLWGNVLDGEKKYVLPYRSTAHGEIDTTLGYEISVLKPYVLPLIQALPETVPCRDQLEVLFTTLRAVDDLDASLVPDNSILREFIGSRT